jgi:hypothetical protein
MKCDVQHSQSALYSDDQKLKTNFVAFIVDYGYF